MSAVRNLTVDAYASYSVGLQCLDSAGEPVNLTGYSALAQIRTSVTSAQVTATFTCSVDVETGTVELMLPISETKKLQGCSNAALVWDCFLSSASDAFRLISGRVFVNPAVSRSAE